MGSTDLIMPSVTNTSAWTNLKSHFDEEACSYDLRLLFKEDPKRFTKHSIPLEDDLLFFDYSKNLVSDMTMNLLLQLAKECNVEEARDKMFSGGAINTSEGRAVLHTALRNLSKDDQVIAQGNGGSSGQNVLPMVHAELGKMKVISEAVRTGSWLGYTGKPITDVVNIGIGGSDLGPVMAVEALKAYSTEDIEFHFVSNIDGSQLATVLDSVQSAETTLFIIVSKTFTTAETMKNAQSARSWLLESQPAEAVSKHFIAVSTNHAAVSNFGINERNVVGFWDWVGGRYSLWSAVGLVIMIAIGYDNFISFLQGANRIDRHFKETPLDRNIPVLMALLGVWYGNFWGAQTHAVLPYEQYLHRFPAYLQQADMESNGKGATKDGNMIHEYMTGPIVWGEPGTNGQHAFFQLLHQGTRIVPTDFLAGINPVVGNNQAGIDYLTHHQMLLANFFAQTEALMSGKTSAKVAEELGVTLNSATESQSALIVQKTFSGNRPSNAILYRQLDPYTLGAIIALYEHKIFVQGIIWGINSFDQWGVELGKQLASIILNEMQEKQIGEHDQSTSGLLKYYLSKQKN